MAAKTLPNTKPNDKPDSIPIADLLKLLAEMEAVTTRTMHRAVGQERMADALRALGSLFAIGELRRRLSHTGVAEAPESTRLDL